MKNMDYSAHEYSGMHDKKSPAKDSIAADDSYSGLKAGVKDGLSAQEMIGDLDPGQLTKGSVHKPCPTSGTASERRNGKTFKWG